MTIDTQTADVDLQNLGTTIESADTLLAAFKYENAVQGYQVAASSGLNLAAAIGTDTDPIHQTVALANQILALNWNLASQQTAQQAQSLVKQMQAQLRSALSAAPLVVVPTATPTAPAAAPSTHAMWLAIGGLAAVAAGGFVWWYFSKRPRDNPSGRAERSTPSAKKSLIAKGSRSSHFEMIDGPDVTAAGGMLHDPSGRWWPRRSVLFGPFRANVRSATDDEFRGPAKDYLGHSHHAHIGTIDLPPKGLGDWEYVGDVERIFYTRTGKKRPGRYQHAFNKSTALATLVKGKGRVRLYRRGRYVRLELPRGAMLDSRGYVWP